MSADSYYQTIEKLIDAGKMPKPARRIQAYLRQSNHSDQSRLRAAVLYRKVGDYPNAFRILGKRVQVSAYYKESPTQARLQLETARLMGQLGAEGTAAKLLDQVYPAVAELVSDAPAFMDIWNGNYERAFRHFQKFIDLPDEELALHNRMRIIFAGYCCAQFKQHEKADALLRRAIAFSPEPKMRAHASVYLGMNYFFQEKYLEARRYSEEAATLLSELDHQDPTIAEALEWHGASLIFLGEYDLAEKALAQGAQLVNQAGVSPTPFYNILFWQGFLRHRKGESFPEEWLRVVVSPAPPHLSIQYLVEKHVKLPSEIMFGLAGPTQTQGKIHFDLSCDVKTVSQIGEGPSLQIGLSLLDKALVYLVCAGTRGMSQYRLYDMLWPGDFSIDQVNRRIGQIVTRLRKDGLEITWAAGDVKLMPPASVTVLWSPNPKPLGWNFLKDRESFTRRDVELYFSVSKSSALSICKEWLARQIIESTTRGRLTLYKRVEETKAKTSPAETGHLIH